MERNNSGTGGSPLRKLRAYLFFWTVFAAFLVGDQVSKHWIEISIQPPPEHVEAHHRNLPPNIEVIENFFWIVHVHNDGAAWGILKGFGWLLSLLAMAALLGIYLYRHTLQLHTTYMQWVFGLLCSGIMGNLLDRLRLGYVVDFLDFLIGSYHWPAFNIADSAIFCGVVLYLIHSWRNPEGNSPAKK